MSDLPSRPVLRLTARSPEDLLAAVPIVLGFVPHDSVVMLTFGAERAFHARVDLPTDEGHAEVVGALLDPALRHRVGRVVFVIYSDDPAATAAMAGELATGFHSAGIEVVDVLRADGRRWFAVSRPRPGVPPGGIAYDLSHHRFSAQSVLDGRVTHGSRHDLAASLASDDALVAQVEVALATVSASSGPAAGPSAGNRWDDDLGWVRATVAREAAHDELPDPQVTARLLLALSSDGHRDAAWALISRGSAPDHVWLWTRLVRCAPERLLAPPAALLAFAAWLSGQGALAWCALDRCRAADPGYRLAGLVAQALEQAVPPDVWEPPWDPSVS